MRTVRIAGADDTPLAAPPNWDKDQNGHCGALFVRREVIGGVAYMRSAWEAEGVEAAMLLAGAHLTLGVAGHCHPVVQVGLDKLPDDFPPVLTAVPMAAPNGQPGVRVEMLFPYGGGRRAFMEVPVDETLADAVATAITKCQKLAREQGWIE